MPTIVRAAVAILTTPLVLLATSTRAAVAPTASASSAPAPAAASSSAAASAPEITWRSLFEDTVYRVSADGTEVVTYTRRHRILKLAALSSMKESTISYSQSAQKLEVLEAYTIKLDGRRIDAPPANYQVHTESGR